MKCETSTLEIKSAEQGCPQRLYDTLSSFPIRMMVESLSLVWMKKGYKEVGVYDPQDIQKK